MSLPACPKCHDSYTYQDGDLLICPMCSHEWQTSDTADSETQAVIKDAVGNILQDGDSVTVIKDFRTYAKSIDFA